MKKHRANRASNSSPVAASGPAGASDKPRLLPWFALFALAGALAWIAYLPAINGGFVFDDITLTFRSDPNYAARDVRGVIHGVRPLVELSHWLVYRLAGAEPFLHHLVSVLIHAASAVLFGYVLLRMLTLLGVKNDSARRLSALGAAVFLLHPVNTEAVAYVTSRSEVLSAFFYLAALAVFLGRSEPEISWRRSFVVFALFLLALLSKEQSITLPIVLVLLDLYVYRLSPAQLVRYGRRLYGLMLAGAAVGGALALQVLRGAVTAGFGMKDLTWWEYLLTEGRAIVLYLRLFLLPVNQNGDYLFPISRSPLEHGAIFYWMAIAAGAVAALVYRKRAPLISLGTLLFLVLLVPTSSILPIQDAAVERRVYLSSIGLIIALVGVLRRVHVSPTLMRNGGLALLFVLGAATYHRSQVWASHEAFWNDVLAKDPENWRANVQTGLTSLEAGRCAEAIAHFEKAMPNVAGNFAASLRMNYARALACEGKAPEAEKEFKTSLRIESQAATWTQLGVFYASHDRPADAFSAFNQAVALDPSFPPAYSNRGNLYARLGNCALARPDFETALRLMPSNSAAQRGIAYCREREGR